MVVIRFPCVTSLFVLVVVLRLLATAAETPAARAGQLVVSDADLSASVAPLSQEMFRSTPHNPRAERLLQSYYDSIHDWGEILAERFRPIPERAEQGYYGRGGHNEDDVRPIAYAAMVNAFLAEVHAPDRMTTEAERVRKRNQAVAALAYLAESHVTGGGTCLDGKPWGDQWQSAMWARAAGMAGWILWPRLDEPTRRSLARLIEHEADRFLAAAPKSRKFGDTGAEENAWNSQIVALAANMMPRHPHAPLWDQSAKQYMYNTLSVASDHRDQRPGDDGRPIREWVTTVNAHPDYTVENHGLVHVGYLKATMAMSMESASHYLLRGQPAPRACMHHVPEGMGILYWCAAWDGSPIFFGGNDWKIYHSQATDVVLYAIVNLLENDARAAYVEQVAVDWLRKIQRQEGGYYNVRRDLEYGGLSATRLIACYLAHAVAGEGAKPISETEFDRRASGVYHLESGESILHRTPTKFASFSWGPKRMALSLPRHGNWVAWPHFASYLGIVDGQDPSAKNAKMTRFESVVGKDRFTVAGTLERCRGRLLHDFAFASLPKDVTVYVERLTPREDYSSATRETGVIGHEYALGATTRRLYGEFGEMEVVALGGRAELHEFATDWLNVGDQVGYVVLRTPAVKNVMRYHDLSQGVGRVPKLQEWLSLIVDGDADAGSQTAGEDWACVVTFLNQPASETAEWAGRVRWEVNGQTAACRIGDNVVGVDFALPICRIVKAP